MSAAKAWPQHLKAYKFMSGSCKKQKLYCCCMQSARQDLIHMAASRKKHRGEATGEEQARPNNDDEPSNHVGLCYDTVVEKHCWLSLHIMQVCVVTRRALNEEGCNQRPLATPNSDLLRTEHEAPRRVKAAALPPAPPGSMLFPGVNHCSSQLPKRQVFTARHFHQP